MEVSGLMVASLNRVQYKVRTSPWGRLNPYFVLGSTTERLQGGVFYCSGPLYRPYLPKRVSLARTSSLRWRARSYSGKGIARGGCSGPNGTSVAGSHRFVPGPTTQSVGADRSHPTWQFQEFYSVRLSAVGLVWGLSANSLHGFGPLRWGECSPEPRLDYQGQGLSAVPVIPGRVRRAVRPKGAHRVWAGTQCSNHSNH